MYIVFAALPAYGHVHPLVPLAAACATAGHRVLVVSGGPVLPALPVPSEEIFPPEKSISWAEEETLRRHPELVSPPPDKGWLVGLELFADVSCELMIDGLGPVLDRERPDLVVYEEMAVGAALAAQRRSIPAVAFAIGQRSFFTDLLAQTMADRHGSEVGPVALVDPVPASLQGDGSMENPARIPIRPQSWNDPAAPVPSWLTDRRDGPRLYVTLGTVTFGAHEIETAVLSAASSLDVEVLATVGPGVDPAVLGDQPSRIHIESFVAQDRVLGLVDAVAHHGGTGTLLGACALGLPQVLLPQGADQFLNAETFSRTGAGVVLPPAEVTGDAVREALRVVLSDGPTRVAAQAIQTEISGLPAPADVVASLVQIV